MPSKWKEFDEAVAYLKQYLATDGKMWQSAIVSAHRVLDLLAGMGIEAVYRWRRETMSLYSGNPMHSQDVELAWAEGKFPAAVLSSIQSEPFRKWRMKNEK
jgi:hypothetical protein